MLAAIKNLIAHTDSRWLCLTIVGLACCLISMGTFDGSICSFSNADFFGVRISAAPLSGGVPIVVSCALLAALFHRNTHASHASPTICVSLASISAIGLLLLFLGDTSLIPHWAAEAGGALLTFSSIVTVSLWAQNLARQGIARTLLVLGLAFVLETTLDLLIENALVDIAGMVVLVGVVVASPLLLVKTAGMVKQAGRPTNPACIGADEGIGFSQAQAKPQQPASNPEPSPAISLPLSLACIFLWGFLMGRVQGMGSETESSSQFLAFLTGNAVGVSALAVAMLCLVIVNLKHAFGVVRIIVLAMLACSLYFSGTFGPISIPVGMFAMGTARMAAFIYIWMLACDITARSQTARSGQAANANAAPFVIVAGWGLFTVANTLSTKFGLLLVAGSTAFLIYNVAIMASLAALIVVEFLPRRAMQDELAPQETPQAALSEQGSNTEEIIAQRCAQLAERYGLTDREREVLVPLVRGRSAASIAAQLSMSTETARTHIRHIYQKTDIHSREELMDIVDGM